MSTTPPDIFPIFTDIPVWHAAARDVTFVSSILRDARGSDGSLSKKEYSESMKLWSAISFLLSTGDPHEDPHGSKVVAVTGSIVADGIRSVVVSRNLRRERGGRTSRVYEVDQPTPGSILQGGSKILREKANTEYVY